MLILRRLAKSQSCEQGSITVEAILALPIFIFAFITVTMLANVAKVESMTQYAIDQTAKEISKYTYIAYKLGINTTASDGANGTVDNVDDAVQAVFNLSDAVTTTSGSNNNDTQGLEGILNGVTDVNNFENVTSAAQQVYSSFKPLMSDPKGTVKALLQVFAYKAGSAIASRVIAQPLCRTLMQKYITSDGDADAMLKKLGVEDGINGLNFSMSSFLMDGRTINVIVVYKIKLNGFGIFDRTIVVKQTACTAGWVRSVSLKEISEKESTWELSPTERGKKFTEEIKNEDPHKSVTGGKGIDLYDQDTNTFTAIHSINVNDISYSDYSKDSNPNYTLKKDVIKSKVSSYASDLLRDVKDVDVDLKMEDGTRTQTAKVAVKDRKSQLTMVVPDDAKNNADALNQIASEIKAETGVTVNWTYRK